MKNLDDIIMYENESTDVDFKAKQYLKDDHEALLKDVMSMANSDTDSDSYIIIGIKHKPSGDRGFIDVMKDEFIDGSNYQELILSNIEPEINIDYFLYNHDGHDLGIIRIYNNNNKPYIMKKDFKSLKKGDAYIRKGSHQLKMLRSDFDTIYQKKKNPDFIDDVDILFENQTDTIELEIFEGITLPSEREEEEIKAVIEKKKKNLIPPPNPFAIRISPFMDTPYEEMKIEELEKMLAKIHKTYRDDDLYELFEKHAYQINLFAHNNNDRYVEDASIQIEIERDAGIIIADKIYYEPDDGIYHTIRPIITDNINYPKVTYTDEKILISNEIGNIKHNIPAEVFQVPLRIILYPELLDKEIIINCKLFGKNIKKSIDKTLKIKGIKKSG